MLLSLKPESAHMSKYSTPAFLRELHSRASRGLILTFHPSGRWVYDACLASSIFSPLIAMIAMRARMLSKPDQRHSKSWVSLNPSEGETIPSRMGFELVSSWRCWVRLPEWSQCKAISRTDSQRGARSHTIWSLGSDTSETPLFNLSLVKIAFYHL